MGLEVLLQQRNHLRICLMMKTTICWEMMKTCLEQAIMGEYLLCSLTSFIKRNRHLDSLRKNSRSNNSTHNIINLKLSNIQWLFQRGCQIAVNLCSWMTQWIKCWMRQPRKRYNRPNNTSRHCCHRLRLLIQQILLITILKTWVRTYSIKLRSILTMWCRTKKRL